MASAHKRKKEPEQVRAALLSHAALLARDHGLAAVTVQAVAAAAGVTKGGFTHHFPSKRELVAAVFQQMLEHFDHDLDRRIEADPEPFGSFTRAYVSMIFEDGEKPWHALAVSILAEPELREQWAAWYTDRIERHRRTDNDHRMAIARLAADGVWLADITFMKIEDRAVLRAQLIALTERLE